MIPVRISKYKNIFANFCSVPNWSKEVFVIKKIKKSVPWIYVISDLQKANKKEFRIEKVMRINDMLNDIMAKIVLLAVGLIK